MFSPRFFAVCVLLVTVAALPTDKPIPRPVTTITEEDVDDAPWFSFPLFGNLFAPLWKLLPTFTQFGPKIVTDQDKFEVIVNVKDYKKEDLKVKIKNDFIFVQGSHEAKPDGHDIFASQFFQTYTLPANSSADDVTATLTSDGFLVVDAPLNGSGKSKDKEVDREVPIVESGAPYQKEEESKETAAPNTAAPDVISEDEDRKEPTTPPNQEVTDKDNVIPHGNEIL